MTHFLWVEDFKASENNRDSNIISSTVKLVFGSVLNNEELDKALVKEDEYDAHDFLEEKGIFLQLNLLEALEFIRNPNELAKIDFVVLDVDMPLKRDEQNDDNNYLPSLIEQYKSADDLRKIAGYQIYTELVIELGFPKKHILFCSNHANYFEELKGKFSSANINLPISSNPEKPFLTKNDDADIKQWLDDARLDYFVLRRGIIEACQYLKSLPDEKLQFKEFIKKDADKKIELEDIRNYLGVLENFLPLRKPSDKTARYKLFVRTLAHEWDIAEPQLINKADKNTGQYAFVWIMKMTRNWMAHGKVFEQLTAQEVAYLFIVNMRAMFDLGSDLLSYEKHLLSLFKSITVDEMKDKIGNFPKKDETNLRKIPLAKKYALLLNRYKNFEAINFHDALNGLQKRSHDEKDNDFLIKGLFQTFWFLTSNGYVYIPSDKDRNIAIDKVYDDLKYQFKYFDYHKDSQDYLFELARYIYNYSFTEV